MQVAGFLKRYAKPVYSFNNKRASLNSSKHFCSIYVYRIFWLISSKSAIIFLCILSKFYVFLRKTMGDVLIAEFDYISIKADQYSISVCTLK